MREAILVLVVAVALGCAARLWPPEIAFGGADIKSGCKEDGHCERETTTDEMGADVLPFVLRLVDAIPGVELGQAPSATVHHTHADED